MRNRRGQRCASRKPQETIHHKLSYGQRMGGVSSGNRISSELREVASKPRVLRLKQVLDACVLEDRPKILHEPWLRIYTEQISERVEGRGDRSTVTMADGRNQISQLLDPKLVGAKLEMPGLMGGHDEK